MNNQRRAELKKGIADILFQRGESFLNDAGVDEKVCEEVAEGIVALIQPCRGCRCAARPKGAGQAARRHGGKHDSGRASPPGLMRML